MGMAVLLATISCVLVAVAVVAAMKASTSADELARVREYDRDEAQRDRDFVMARIAELRAFQEWAMPLIDLARRKIDMLDRQVDALGRGSVPRWPVCPTPSDDLGSQPSGSEADR